MNNLFTIFLLITLSTIVLSSDPSISKIINYLPDIQSDYSIAKQIYNQISAQQKLISKKQITPAVQEQAKPKPIAAVPQPSVSVTTSNNNIITKEDKEVTIQKRFRTTEQQLPNIKIQTLNDHDLQILQQIVHDIKNINDEKVVSQNGQITKIIPISTPFSKIIQIQTNPSAQIINTRRPQPLIKNRPTTSTPTTPTSLLNPQDEKRQEFFKKWQDAIKDVTYNKKNDNFMQQLKNLGKMNLNPFQRKQDQPQRQNQNLVRTDRVQFLTQKTQQKQSDQNLRKDQRQNQHRPQKGIPQTKQSQNNEQQTQQSLGKNLLRKSFSIILIMSIFAIIYSYTPEQKGSRKRRSYNPSSQEQQTILR